MKQIYFRVIRLRYVMKNVMMIIELNLKEYLKVEKILYRVEFGEDTKL